MNIVSLLISYLMIWIIVFFMALPIGVKTFENPELGHATSAPQRPMILAKFLISSLVSLVILALLVGAATWWGMPL